MVCNEICSIAVQKHLFFLFRTEKFSQKYSEINYFYFKIECIKTGQQYIKNLMTTMEKHLMDNRSNCRIYKYKSKQYEITV